MKFNTIPFFEAGGKQYAGKTDSVSPTGGRRLCLAEGMLGARIPLSEEKSASKAPRPEVQLKKDRIVFFDGRHSFSGRLPVELPVPEEYVYTFNKRPCAICAEPEKFQDAIGAFNHGRKADEKIRLSQKQLDEIRNFQEGYGFRFPELGRVFDCFRLDGKFHLIENTTGHVDLNGDSIVEFGPRYWYHHVRLKREDQRIAPGLNSDLAIAAFKFNSNLAIVELDRISVLFLRAASGKPYVDFYQLPSTEGNILGLNLLSPQQGNKLVAVSEKDVITVSPSEGAVRRTLNLQYRRRIAAQMMDWNGREANLTLHIGEVHSLGYDCFLTNLKVPLFLAEGGLLSLTLGPEDREKLAAHHVLYPVEIRPKYQELDNCGWVPSTGPEVLTVHAGRPFRFVRFLAPDSTEQTRLPPIPLVFYQKTDELVLPIAPDTPHP